MKRKPAEFRRRDQSAAISLLKLFSVFSQKSRLYPVYASILALFILFSASFVKYVQAETLPITDADSLAARSEQGVNVAGIELNLSPGVRLAHVQKGFLPELDWERPEIGLAFSGGGARGLAAVGFLEVMEEENLPVDRIVGTSMGAVVAGFYALGYNAEEIAGITKKIDWSTIFSDAPHRRNLFLAQKETANRELLTVRFKGPMNPYIPNSIFTGEALFLKMLRLTLESPAGAVYDSYENGEVPVGFIATDLGTGKRRFLREGDMTMALRSSMAIPIVFRPVRYNGMLLVDGGAVENIPVFAAREMGSDIVVALDCTSPRTTQLDPDSPWEIANQVTTLMTVVKDSLSRVFADMVVTPDLTDFTQTDFNKSCEIIEKGREAAREALPELQALIGGSVPPPEIKLQIRKIVVGALPSWARTEALEQAGLRTGETTTRAVNKGLKKFLWALHEKGYGAAKLKAEIREGDILVISVDPGVVREIRIEGVPEQRMGMVFREIRVKRGQPLRTRELIATLTRLHATGRYTVVYSYFSSHPEGGVTLTLLLEEAPFPKIGIGLGFDTDRQARYFANLVIKSGFLRLGEELTLRGKYGIRDRKFGIDLRVDRLANTYAGLEIPFEYSEREQDLFNRNGDIVYVAEVKTMSGGAEMLFNLSTWGKLSAELKGERVRDDLSGQWNDRFFNGVMFRAGIDTEDRRPFPRSGAKISLQYDSYLTPLGSEIAFNRFSLHSEAVIPVFSRHVLRLAFRSGVADPTTPPTHRFRIGGLTDFPAFKPDRFMALRRVAGTAEWRYDLISRFIADAYLVARYDVAGFSDERSWRPRRDDLVHSFAAGFALNTFLGPLEIWYAWSPTSSTANATERVAVNLGFRF